MPRRTEDQGAFVAAIFNPEQAVPEGLTSRTGARPLKRFNVYRNNVFVSLIEALEGRFPAVCRLVGEEFFRATARAFIENHPPRSPVLLHYGGEFPGFLDGFEPAVSVPYLADVARLEWAWNEAYHAPDASPLSADEMSALASADIANATITLHPSLRFVASSFPVVMLWTAMTDETDLDENTLDAGPEDALVLRPELDVEVRQLPVGAVTFIASLGAGKTLLEAAEAAGAENSEFDLSANLAGLMQCGAICDIALPTASEQPSSQKELNHV